MSGFVFRHQFEGYVTDEALAQLVGQETVVTGLLVAQEVGDPHPVEVGRYRITGATRITAPPHRGGLNTTVVMIHLDRIEDHPHGTAPSGEEANHAQDPDRPD